MAFPVILYCKRSLDVEVLSMCCSGGCVVCTVHVLKLSKLKSNCNRIGIVTNRFKCFAIYILNSLDLGETPGYSATHMTPNYFKLS